MDFCLLLKYGKNISRNVSQKYSQKLLDHAKESAGDPLNIASKLAIPKNNRSNL